MRQGAGIMSIHVDAAFLVGEEFMMAVNRLTASFGVWRSALRRQLAVLVMKSTCTEKGINGKTGVKNRGQSALSEKVDSGPCLEAVKPKAVSGPLLRASECIGSPLFGWQASGLAALDGLQACRA